MIFDKLIRRMFYVESYLRYFSHLDWQNTFLKALARSGLEIAFSQGFNPSMKVSLGVALPLFIESDCELVDIELKENIQESEIKLKLEKVLPRLRNYSMGRVQL